MVTRSQLSGFMNGDKIGVWKIILSQCFVNISDGVKIPIVRFYEWGQDTKFENHLGPMICKYIWWRQDPHCIVRFYEWGQDTKFENHFGPLICKYFSLIRKILSLSFINSKMEIMSPLYYLPNRGIMSLETMAPSAMGTRSYELPYFIFLTPPHYKDA